MHEKGRTERRSGRSEAGRRVGRTLQRRKRQIGTCRAERGEISRGELEVATDAEGHPITIPVAIVQGMDEGKTAFLSAGVHGDELNGIATLQRFMQSLDVERVRGTIVILPLVNLRPTHLSRWIFPSETSSRSMASMGNSFYTLSRSMASGTGSALRRRCTRSCRHMRHEDLYLSFTGKPLSQ